MIKLTSFLLIAVTLFYSIKIIDKDCISSAMSVSFNEEIIQTSLKQSTQTSEMKLPDCHQEHQEEDSSSHTCHIGHCSFIIQNQVVVTHVRMPLIEKSLLRFQSVPKIYISQKLRPPSLS